MPGRALRWRPAGPDVALLLTTGLTAVGVVVLAYRWGVWRWLAVLVALPGLLPLLDPGQHPARDATFVLLTTVAAVVACWRATPWLPAAAAFVAAASTVVGAFWNHSTPSAVAGMELVPLLIGSLLAAAAALGLGRAAPSGMASVAALTGLLPILVLLVGWRSGGLNEPGGLLALAWCPLAGAIGLTALIRGRRGRAVARPQADEHDARALADFGTRLAQPSLAPLVVVIAAYNEAPGIPAVLDELPGRVSGLDVDVVVVDDGSHDDTAEAVLAHGRAHLVRPGVNRGQGAALRLGYRVAREHGARYVITTDADGQYDPADFARVLAPVLDGSADFATGSRRLGEAETRDRVRRLGVHVFAWLVSGLTGRWTTDTSFGLRAMRADLTAEITLNQPQYQSSELMIGVLSHGYRLAEVPARMRVRSEGTSKKGGNLVYGSRYARVVLGTWWREGCPRPVGETAPALVGQSEPAYPTPTEQPTRTDQSDPV